MKNAFKKYLKGSAKKTATPRSKAEIEQEYTTVCSKVGHLQYHIKVLESDLSSLFNRIVELDLEGRERRKLDEAAAKANAALPQVPPNPEPITSGAV